eukprot:GHVP01029849.1.p1 GENE.GHVP01029849.1~~GHVP01029849.1.p1  ORF type:complete len:351 (+),score=58.45 GHVP01029849.1:3-1055(+)
MVLNKIVIKGLERINEDLILSSVFPIIKKDVIVDDFIKGLERSDLFTDISYTKSDKNNGLDDMEIDLKEKRSRLSLFGTLKDGIPTISLSGIYRNIFGKGVSLFTKTYINKEEPPMIEFGITSPLKTFNRILSVSIQKYIDKTTNCFKFNTSLFNGSSEYKMEHKDKKITYSILRKTDKIETTHRTDIAMSLKTLLIKTLLEFKKKIPFRNLTTSLAFRYGALYPFTENNFFTLGGPKSVRGLKDIKNIRTIEDTGSFSSLAEFGLSIFSPSFNLFGKNISGHLFTNSGFISSLSNTLKPKIIKKAFSIGVGLYSKFSETVSIEANAIIPLTGNKSDHELFQFSIGKDFL